MKIVSHLNILMTLTSSELKGRYRNTIAGFLWVALNPIIMFSVHALVFKHIMRINTENYFIFLLSGLLPWLFLSQNMNTTCHSLVTNREVLLSFPIPPITIIASKTIDNFINFLFPFLILFIFLSFSYDFNLYGILLFPINTLILLIGGFALAVFFSTIQVFIRDTQYILNFITSILYFLTPIFYPEKMVPEQMKFIIKINPIYHLIKPFKVSLWQFNFNEYINSLALAIISISIIATVSFITWRAKRNELYLHI